MGEVTLESLERDVTAEIHKTYGVLKRRLDRIDEEAALARGAPYLAAGLGSRGGKGLADAIFEHPDVEDFRRKGSRGHVRFVLEGCDLNREIAETKTVITETAVGSGTSGVIMPDRYRPGFIVAPPQPRIRVRDLIPRYPVNSNAVDWLKENTFQQVTSPSAEAATKPESEMTFTVDSVGVRLIATWIPASRQIMDDLVGLRQFVVRRLLNALADEEDSQILFGDGTGQNISGLSVEGTAFDDATYNQTGDSAVDKILRMITQLQDSNFEASGVVMHPRDWAILKSIKSDFGGGAGTGPYVISGGPLASPSPTIWGVPVATSTAMTVGTAFAGAFSSHTALFVRQDPVVDISSEHSDYFVRNLLAVRVEQRVAFGVLRSDSVIYESSL